jgi:hypothetical protein
VTGAPGEVACEVGESLPWPSGAPGFAYDALGALERPAGSPFAGSRGSRAPVSSLGCMLACEAAPRCDAFAYNAHQRRCFLKALPPGGGGGACLVAADACTSARGQAGECGRWQTYWRRGGGGGGAERPHPSRISRSCADPQRQARGAPLPAAGGAPPPR